MTKTFSQRVVGDVETTEEANLTLRITRTIINHQVVDSKCELIRPDNSQVYNVQIGPKPDDNNGAS